MSYSCLEELQVDLDLHTLDKTNVLSKAGCKYDDGWLVITDDGICHLFDKDGNLDDIKKVKNLEKNHIKNDIIKIVIPDSVINIGRGAFFGCSNLMSVTFGNSVTSIRCQAFAYCINLTNLTIQNSVTNIEDWAFSNCWKGLTSVTIPNSASSIGRGVFANCSNLINLTIPDSVTSIGNFAFEDCIKLTSMTIPSSVLSIGCGAFFYCNDLTNLTFKGKTLEQVKKMKNYPWAIKDKSIISVE